MKLLHWPLMGGLLHLVQRGGDWVEPQPAQSPPRCTKCNSPPINGQCISHRIAVLLSVAHKGSTNSTDKMKCIDALSQLYNTIRINTEFVQKPLQSDRSLERRRYKADLPLDDMMHR